MLATSTSAPGFGHYNFGATAHHNGGQSPGRGVESLRHHLSAEATSLTSKVHTVILTGKRKKAKGLCALSEGFEFESDQINITT